MLGLISVTQHVSISWDDLVSSKFRVLAAKLSGTSSEELGATKIAVNQDQGVLVKK